MRVLCLIKHKIASINIIHTVSIPRFRTAKIILLSDASLGKVETCEAIHNRIFCTANHFYFLKIYRSTYRLSSLSAFRYLFAFR